MNERELSDLLERATRDLTPDVGSLVAGGLQRGMARRRRRRTAMSLGAGLATVLVTTGVLQLSGELASRGSDLPPAATPTTPPATTAATTRKPTRSPGATAPRARLAVTTDEVPATFASIEPGEVSAPLPKSGPDSAPVVDFTWHGFGVRVGLTPDDYVSGHRGEDPAARCAESTDDPCLPGPDGTVMSRSEFVNPPEDGGTTGRSVAVFRPDGWDVLVMTYNGPAREGPVTAAEPPLTIDQLQQIATSDVWFR